MKAPLRCLAAACLLAGLLAGVFAQPALAYNPDDAGLVHEEGGWRYYFGDYESYAQDSFLTIGEDGVRYFDGNGYLAVGGWFDRDGRRYYASGDYSRYGVLYQSGVYTIDGEEYEFGGDCALVRRIEPPPPPTTTVPPSSSAAAPSSSSQPAVSSSVAAPSATTTSSSTSHLAGSGTSSDPFDGYSYHYPAYSYPAVDWEAYAASYSLTASYSFPEMSYSLPADYSLPDDLSAGLSLSGIESVGSSFQGAENDLPSASQSDLSPGGLTATGGWSLVNLLLAQACLLGGFALIVRFLLLRAAAKQKTQAPSTTRPYILTLCGAGAGLVPLPVFLLLENLAGPALAVDLWTPLFIALFLLHLGLLVASLLPSAGPKARRRPRRW